MTPITVYWNGLRSGNESDLVEIHQCCYRDFIRYGLKCAANEDLTRDTINELFLELWDKRHALPEVVNVKQYLLTWYKRKLFKKLHAENKNARLEAHAVDLMGSERSYEDYIIQLQTDKDVQKKLEKALLKLSPRQKQLIQLRFYEGLSTDEIALQTSLAIRTVYNKLHEALKTLRKELFLKK